MTDESTPRTETLEARKHVLACGCATVDDFVMYPCRFHAYLVRDRDALARLEREMEGAREAAARYAETILARGGTINALRAERARLERENAELREIFEGQVFIYENPILSPADIAAAMHSMAKRALTTRPGAGERESEDGE